MSKDPTSIRAAKALAVFISASGSGLLLGVSTFMVPRLLELPVPAMLRAWSRLLIASRNTLLALGAAAAVPYWYLAYRFWGLRASKLYLLAGALCVATVPYTMVVVMPTNRKLLRKVQETRTLGAAEEVVEVGVREESAKYLVDHWGILHLPRVAMVAVAGMIGLGLSL